MTQEPGSPTDDTLQSRLGSLLKRQREEAQLDQGRMSDLLDRSQPTVSKIEKGGTSISRGRLKEWLTACRTSEEAATEIWRIWELLNSPARLRGDDLAAIPAWFVRVVEREQQAKTLMAWSGEKIHGMLQSEAYMLLVFDGARRGTVMFARMQYRKQRQKLLLDSGKKFVFVLSASALDRLCAQPGHIAEDQLGHMIKLAGYPNITIHLLSYRAMTDAGPDFVIMQFPGDERDQAYTEDLTNANWANKAQLPVWYRSWDALVDLADSAEETLAELHRRYRHMTSSGPEKGQ